MKYWFKRASWYRTWNRAHLTTAERQQITRKAWAWRR